MNFKRLACLELANDEEKRCVCLPIAWVDPSRFTLQVSSRDSIAITNKYLLRNTEKLKFAFYEVYDPFDILSILFLFRNGT